MLLPLPHDRIVGSSISVMVLPISLPILTVLLFLFFGLHNLLQEAILDLPDSPSGIVLAFLEVLGVTVFTCIERAATVPAPLRVRSAPLSSFFLQTFLLLTSSSGCRCAQTSTF